MSTPPTPFIDSLLAKTFRTDANGRLLFAPFGPQQKTFIVPPDRAKARIHFLRRFYGVLLGGMALGGLAFGSRGVVAVVPAGVAWYFVYIWRFTRDLQIAGKLPPTPIPIPQQTHQLRTRPTVRSFPSPARRARARSHAGRSS